MKHKSINSYAQHVHEGIASTIIKYLFANKLKPAVEELQDLVSDEDNAQLEADVKQWKLEMDKIESKIDAFCKRVPESPLCKRRERDKNRPHFKWR